jgi:hypothetical protein
MTEQQLNERERNVMRGLMTSHTQSSLVHRQRHWGGPRSSAILHQLLARDLLEQHSQDCRCATCVASIRLEGTIRIEIRAT